MKFAAISDIGKIRALNEDSYAVFNAGPFGVMVVADGMGGHNAGEVASSCAVNIIKEFICGQADRLEIGKLLLQSMKLANEYVYHKSKSDLQYRSMGTTVVLCCTKDHTAYFANVGDSRGYLISDKGIRQITSDDSIVAELVRRGEITEEAAKTHPQRNVITKAVGTDSSVEPGISRVSCSDGDIVLLCSDGLTAFVENDEILSVMKQNDIDTGVRTLVDMANERGGHDNITVTAVKIGEVDE